MPTPKTVELHMAWSWDCDACGRENFTRGLRPEFTKEDVREIARDLGVKPRDVDLTEFTGAPETVRCPHCGATFTTEN